MKLSTAQKKVIDDATAKIDFARSHNFYDWYRKAMNCATYSDDRIDQVMARNDEKLFGIGGKEYEMRSYEGYKNGEVLVTANTKTLAKLEEMGVIKIIKEGGMYPDLIKVINY